LRYEKGDGVVEVLQSYSFLGCKSFAAGLSCNLDQGQELGQAYHIAHFSRFHPVGWLISYKVENINF